MLSRNGEHVAAPMGEELAMMDIDAGKYYVLDEVAAFIWARLETPVSVAGLVAELGERYDVTPERCEADILPFLAHLDEKGLVRVQAYAALAGRRGAARRGLGLPRPRAPGCRRAALQGDRAAARDERCRAAGE